MHSEHYLTLEFDVMEEHGRPLSIYFYHADKDGERDLTSSEALTSFHRDDLFDYQISQNTQIHYTHYIYTFPNRTINFRVSGNYILRVTEQGKEEEVLFERPFFVTENSTTPRLQLDNVLVESRSFPYILPTLSFTPPASLWGDVFNYHVCFVRNGQFDRSRCSNQPSLTEQPDLLFYLEPEDAFAPEEGYYYLDLSNLALGHHIERIDRMATPYEVLLTPDYARFPSGNNHPLLNGQIVISSANRFTHDADIGGEYTNVIFRYVPPDEKPFSADVFLTGSFNGWSLDPTNQLTWQPAEHFYEGEVLLKQGQYEYRYNSSDQRIQQLLRARLPRPDNLYTALVYFSDISVNTDRLLAVQHIVSR